MNNLALTHNDLETYIASYRDGLIHGHELVCITKACVRNEPMPVWTPFIEASDTLQIAFTTQGIKALITRIQAARELAEETLIGDWTVSPDAKTLSTRVVLHGDSTRTDASSDDHEWLMPRIEFRLPEGSIIGDVLADQHRILTITQGLLHFK